MNKYFIILLFAASLSACTNKENKRVSFSGLFESTKQSFIIDNSRDTLITGNQGTKISIPQYAIPNYKIGDTLEVKLEEYYSKSEMIFAELSTTSKRKPIETNGMINLRISLNQNPVDSLNTSLAIEFPKTPLNSRFMLFNGNINSLIIDWTPDTLTNNYQVFYNVVLFSNDCTPRYACDHAMDTLILDSVIWKENYTRIDSIVTFTESSDTIQYSEFFRPRFDSDELYINDEINTIFLTDNLQWINCDRFLEAENLTTLTVAANNVTPPIYFLVFNDINSILPNYEQNSFINVPAGYEADLIGLEERKGKYYFGITSISITEDATVNLELTEMTLNEIRDQIEELDK